MGRTLDAAAAELSSRVRDRLRDLAVEQAAPTYWA